LVHVFAIAVARHALTQRSKGQRKITRLRKPHGRTFASSHGR